MSTLAQTRGKIFTNFQRFRHFCNSGCASRGALPDCLNPPSPPPPHPHTLALCQPPPPMATNGGRVGRGPGGRGGWACGKGSGLFSCRAEDMSGTKHEASLRVGLDRPPQEPHGEQHFSSSNRKLSTTLENSSNIPTTPPFTWTSSEFNRKFDFAPQKTTKNSFPRICGDRCEKAHGHSGAVPQAQSGS